MYANEVEFSELEGKTLESVEVGDDDREIVFRCADGSAYRQYHEQDCCETVKVEDITGDLSDLEGSTVVEAKERTEEGDSDYGTSTWTFYHLRSHAGDATIRWYGESNGYYSERVSFVAVDDDD